MPCCVVDHGVAYVELAQVFNQRFNIADLLLLAAAACGGACSEQLGLGDEVDAVFQPTEAHCQCGVAMPSTSSLAWNSASESKRAASGGWHAESPAGFRGGHRFLPEPAHGAGCCAACSFSRASGSSAPRTTARDGSVSISKIRLPSACRRAWLPINLSLSKVRLSERL
jgi:hypothetical protein